MTKEEIASRFRELQDYICKQLEEVDGKEKFVEDVWSRDEGGGGRTRIISNGNIISKGGVNFSEVFGEVTPAMKQSSGIQGEQFFATGVSIVLHPHSPHIPIIHMNVRYFETDQGVYWFGGGIDLTPHYVVPEQAKAFHQGLKAVCDRYNTGFYTKFKVWADDYFYIPHREETRGIGGVFFDHLSANEHISKDQLLSFCVDLGEIFPELYAFQVACGKEMPIEEKHKSWMLHRRGRYVEFNLVHDRGTKFGLYSGGRTESILMSLPPEANWTYMHSPLEDNNALISKSLLRKGIDWLGQF